MAEKLDNACMINDNSEQTEIHAVFEELLKEAEKLKKEIMKYSGIPYKEDNLETIGEFYYFFVIFIFARFLIKSIFFFIF